MPQASEVFDLTPSLFLWRAYDRSVKSDLFATAAETAAGLFLVDPIPLAPSPLKELTRSSQVAGVLVTNANHLRAAPTYASQFKTPIFAAPGAVGEFESVRAISDGEEISPGVSAITLAGAAPGEVAFHFAEDGGTLVVGDSLINFEPYGFTLLPAKYCSDQKELRRSLRRLLDRDFKRLLFAHGNPILASAHARLAGLLR